jgi:hypothetical protein
VGDEEAMTATRRRVENPDAARPGSSEARAELQFMGSVDANAASTWTDLAGDKIR